MTRIEQIVEVAKQKEKEEGFSEIVRNTKGLWSAYGIGFLEGAIWADNHPALWKPADGDLPEIDKEVIVLVGIKNPVTTDSIWGYEVAFAHRPNPNGWDGRSITTGEVEHYEVQTYGKGGWNIPDVKFWLDCELPKI